MQLLLIIKIKTSNQKLKETYRRKGVEANETHHPTLSSLSISA